MIFCIPVDPATRFTQVGHGWGRAPAVALATIDSAGQIATWQVREVRWNDLHDTGSEGSHHARIVRFLREHQVGCVVAEHMGPGMQRVMAAMKIPTFLGATGPARQCVEQAAAILAARVSDNAVPPVPAQTSRQQPTTADAVHPPVAQTVTTQPVHQQRRIEVAALLIDMDGTVVDSSASVRQVWTGYAEAHGLDPEEVLAFAQGRRPVETLARFAPGDPDPLATSKALQAQEITLNNEVTAVPGALDLWDGIGIRAKDEEQTQEQRPRRAKVALVTSASRSLAAARMAAAGLTMPAVAICAEDISNGKPDPEGYLTAAKALAVPITECLVLEDSPAGIEAALASGAKLIAIGRHAARDAQAAPDACATQTAQADGTDYAGEPDNSAPGVHPSHLATLEDLRGLKARRTASCKIEVIY